MVAINTLVLLTLNIKKKNFDIYFNSLYCISLYGNNTSRMGWDVVNKDLNDLMVSWDLYKSIYLS